MCDHNVWCANWRRRLGGARAGEKYFAPTWVVLLIGMGGDCVTANGWRTDGRKIFRPYRCGGAVMFCVWA